MNYLNIFLIDDRKAWTEVWAEGRARARASPKSGLTEPKIVELGLLGALSSYAIASIGVESSSGLLRATKLYRDFFDVETFWSGAKEQRKALNFSK